MLGMVSSRVLAAAGLALFVAACHAQQPGQAANDSAASQAQSASSTGQPEPTASSMEAGTHYLVLTDNKTHAILFSLHVNGTPAVSMNAPKMRVDLQPFMHSGPNTIVVGWQKQSPSGAGTVTLRSSTGKVASVVVVPASAPKSGLKTVKINE